MRVRCFLKEIRGPRPLRAIALEAGINHGTLSRYENGIMFPRDDEVAALEQAYGAEIIDWYPKRVLLALEFEEAELTALRERLHVQVLPAAGA